MVPDHDEEQRDSAVYQWQTQEDDARADNDAETDRRAHDLDQRSPRRLGQQGQIKALKIEQDRPKGHDHDEQPIIIVNGSTVSRRLNQKVL